MSEKVQRDVEIVLAFVPHSNNRQVAENFANEIEKLQKRADDAASRGQKARLSDAEKTTAKIIEADRRLLGVSRASLKEQRAGADHLAESYRRAGRIQEDAAIKTLKSSQRVLASMMQLGQGLAFIGLAGNEHLEDVARGFLRISGAIDAVSGGLGTVVELAEHLRTIRRLSQDSASAMRMMATAGAAGVARGAVVAGTANAAGAAGGSIAAGAVGGGVAGTTVSAGAGLATAGLAAAKLAAVALTAYEAGTFLVRSFGIVNDRTESFAGALWTMTRAMQDAAETTEKTALRQRQYETRAPMRLREQYGARDDLSQLRRTYAGFFQDDLRASWGGVADVRARMRQVEQDRQFWQAPRATMDPQVQAGIQGMIGDRATQLRKEEVSALEDFARLTRDRLEVAKSELAAARDRLLISKDALKAEFERERGLLARFGELSSGVQQSLKDIAARRAQGKELTGSEARFLQSTGFGSGMTADYFSQKGKEAGGQAVVDLLEQGKQRRAEAEKLIADAYRDIQQATTKQANAADLSARAAAELLQGIRQLEAQLRVSAEQAEQRNLAMLEALQKIAAKASERTGGDGFSEIWRNPSSGLF
jgi:hypothetical protein